MTHPRNYVKVTGHGVHAIFTFHDAASKFQAMSQAIAEVNAHDKYRPLDARGQTKGGATLSVWRAETDWPLCAVIGETY